MDEPRAPAKRVRTQGGAEAPAKATDKQFNGKELESFGVCIVDSLVRLDAQRVYAAGRPNYVFADFGCSFGNTGYRLDEMNSQGRGYRVLLVEIDETRYRAAKEARNPTDDSSRRFQFRKLNAKVAEEIFVEYTSTYKAAHEEKIFFVLGDFNDPHLQRIYSIINFFFCNDFLIPDHVRRDLVTKLEMHAPRHCLLLTTLKNDVILPDRVQYENVLRNIHSDEPLAARQRILASDMNTRDGWQLVLRNYSEGDLLAWTSHLMFYLWEKVYCIEDYAYHLLESRTTPDPALLQSFLAHVGAQGEAVDANQASSRKKSVGRSQRTVDSDITHNNRAPGQILLHAARV
jgi:hypothetical protein